jgi:hypothetical protein
MRASYLNVYNHSDYRPEEEKKQLLATKLTRTHPASAKVEREEARP